MKQNPKTLAQRFLVFRACKRYMERHRRAPTCLEVAETLAIASESAAWHMRALNGADGLPYTMLAHRPGKPAEVFGVGNATGGHKGLLSVDVFIKTDSSKRVAYADLIG